MTLTDKQQELANILDEIKIGETIELSNGDYVYRRSEYSYILNDEKDSYGFYDIYVKLETRI
jgi:hypothetical protein